MQEKEQLVIQLYKQDKTIREIAKQVHMSFRDIGTVIKREFGSDDVKLSRDSQILKLIAKGEKPLDVAIKFNLTASEVGRLHKEYRSLSGMDELNKVYEKLGDKIESFIRLYKATEEQGLSTEEIVNTIRYGNDLTILELKYEKVRGEVKKVEAQKQNLISETGNLENATVVLKNAIANLDKVLEHKTNKVKSLDRQIQKLQSTILWMIGSKEYKKIKNVAHQQIETTLKDKRAILLVAVVAIIEAFKRDPEKQILISNLPNDGVNQPYYMEQQKKELLEVAEQLYDNLSNNLVNATVNMLHFRSV